MNIFINSPSYFFIIAITSVLKDDLPYYVLARIYNIFSLIYLRFRNTSFARRAKERAARARSLSGIIRRIILRCAVVSSIFHSYARLCFCIWSNARTRSRARAIVAPRYHRLYLRSARTAGIAGKITVAESRPSDGHDGVRSRSREFPIRKRRPLHYAIATSDARSLGAKTLSTYVTVANDDRADWDRTLWSTVNWLDCTWPTTRPWVVLRGSRLEKRAGPRYLLWAVSPLAADTRRRRTADSRNVASRDFDPRGKRTCEVAPRRIAAWRGMPAITSIQQIARGNVE